MNEQTKREQSKRIWRFTILNCILSIVAGALLGVFVTFFFDVDAGVGASVASVAIGLFVGLGLIGYIKGRADGEQTATSAPHQAQ